MPVDLDGRLLVASTHAVDQALKRVGLLKGADRVGAVYWLEQTAARALRDQRVAKACPRWASRGATALTNPRGRAGKKWGGRCRFVWNEDETYAMLVKPVTRAGGRKAHLVMTVIARRLDSESPVVAARSLAVEPQEA